MGDKAVYKLIILTPAGEEIPIGTFATERELQQWAEDNLGEIENI